MREEKTCPRCLDLLVAVELSSLLPLIKDEQIVAIKDERIVAYIDRKPCPSPLWNSIVDHTLRQRHVIGFLPSLRTPQSVQ
jgi:hypothetical protein